MIYRKSDQISKSFHKITDWFGFEGTLKFTQL